MNTVNTLVRPPRKAVLAALALGTLPGMAIAASAADTERTVREMELRREQEQADRERADRLRVQQEALNSQQDAIRRLEEARQRLSDNSREVAELSSRIGREYAYAYGGVGGSGSGFVSPRSLLGVSLAGGEPKVGARVAQVSPGGAAAEAGLQAGDVITQLDDLDLTKDSNPDRALSERMSKVEPDTKVKVGVLRNGRRMNFEVTTRATPPPVVAPLGALPRLQVQGRGDALGDIVRMRDGNGRQDITIRRDGPGAPPVLQIRDNGFGNMEFATLSDQLGRYFGVDSGVLVVRAGADAPYGLRDGDVILSIDGRATTTAQHLGRILRSYQPGEKFRLRIQRDRKATEREVTVPADRQ